MLLRESLWPSLEIAHSEHVFSSNPLGNCSAAVLRRAARDVIGFTIDAPEGKRVCWFDDSFRQS